MQLIKNLTDDLKDRECVYAIVISRKILDPNTNEPLEQYIVPKESCKKCYGRGFIGKEVGTAIPIVCSCLHHRIVNYRKENVTKNETIKVQHQHTPKKQASRIIIPNMKG